MVSNLSRNGRLSIHNIRGVLKGLSDTSADDMSVRSMNTHTSSPPTRRYDSVCPAPGKGSPLDRPGRAVVVSRYTWVAVNHSPSWHVRFDPVCLHHRGRDDQCQAGLIHQAVWGATPPAATTDPSSKGKDAGLQTRRSRFETWRVCQTTGTRSAGYVRAWRNWHTLQFQKLLPSGVWVRLPPAAPMGSCCNGSIPPLQGGRSGFESPGVHQAGIAQKVERRSCKAQVAGSIPCCRLQIRLPPVWVVPPSVARPRGEQLISALRD